MLSSLEGEHEEALKKKDTECDISKGNLIAEKDKEKEEALKEADSRCEQRVQEDELS